MACGVLLLAGWLIGCGREDVELAPVPTVPTPADDCSASIPDGLIGARPPMGWNGYNVFGCARELNEAKVKEMAQAMKASGMQSAGYRFVNLDDCWQQLPRSSDGRRVFDAERLPSGVTALSDYVHDLGFSFGVFSRIQDCGNPGGAGYEAIDAESYALWGVDYLKYASCTPTETVTERSITDLVTAIAHTGHPITVSLATPPFHEWMRDKVQLWRTSTNAAPTWSAIVSAIDATVPLAAYARPGAFNDPDMLEIGNGSLTAGEKRVQFSVWSILSAPLLAGNDLTTMTEETRAILTNPRLIALNQDPLGLQAVQIRRDGEVDVLAKPLAECGARAAVLWNRGEQSAEVSLTWQELWLEPGAASVQDLWDDSPIPVEPQGFTVTVPGHDAVALRVQGVEPARPHGRVALSDLHWTYVTNGFGPVELDRTNGEDRALDGQPIQLRNRMYPKGLGVHAPSLIRYRLGQACTRFSADVGIDDDVKGQGSVQFEVWADGERLFQSGLLTGTSPGVSVDLPVSGRRELRLFVAKAGDSYTLDHSVWAGATLECDPGMPPP